MEGNINNGKELWKAVHKVTGKNQSHSIKELQYQGKTSIGNSQIAETLNEFFCGKLIKIKQSLAKPPTPYVEELMIQPPQYPELSFLEITKSQLDTYVKELKNTGANGTDTIPAHVFKDAYFLWHREMLHLTNLSLCTGIFPNCLKKTKILPSLKKGKEETNPESYRPISSLNMLAKVIERAGIDQLQNHCESNKIICDEQHGGRARHSTATCLVELQEEYQKAKDSGLKCGIMAIDLSATYDLCNHKILDQQIRIAGADNLVRKWVQSFLGGRYQLVEISGTCSKLTRSLEMGLCQGSRASGTLFAIYTNALPKAAQTNNNENEQIPTMREENIGNKKERDREQKTDQTHKEKQENEKNEEQQRKKINVKINKEESKLEGKKTRKDKLRSKAMKRKMNENGNKATEKRKRKKKVLDKKDIVRTKQFVDDTSVLVAASTNARLKILLQNTYLKLERHLICLEMAINREKTQLTIMCPNEEGREITITAGEKKIKHQQSLTILGFQFAEDGKMDTYLWKGESNLTRAIRIKVSMMRVIKPFVSQKQLANIGNMVINSQILYMAPLWALTSQGNIEMIQKAQTKAARQLTWTRRIKYTEKIHRQDLMEKIGWLNVRQMLDQSTVNLVKKAAVNRASQEINNMFNLKENGNRRKAQQFLIETENTTKRKGINILEQGKRIFNQLPIEMRNNTMNDYQFKKELKLHTKEHNLLPYH